MPHPDPLPQNPDSPPPLPPAEPDLPEAGSSQGRAVAALVPGLCSGLLRLCPLAGLGVSIPGLVPGIQARRRGQGGMAVAGIVLSSIGLVLSVLNAAVGAYMGATGVLEDLAAP